MEWLQRTVLNLGKRVLQSDDSSVDMFMMYVYEGFKHVPAFWKHTLLISFVLIRSGSSCNFAHEKESEDKSDESQTAVATAADDEASSSLESDPEPAPPTAAGAQSMLKGKVIKVDEEKRLVHLAHANLSRVVNLQSFTDLWPVLPRPGDCISFPPPPGGPTSRWIIPTLESISAWSCDMALKFMKSLQESYDEQGSNLLLRTFQGCQIETMTHIVFQKD